MSPDIQATTNLLIVYLITFTDCMLGSGIKTCDGSMVLLVTVSDGDLEIAVHADLSNPSL